MEARLAAQMEVVTKALLKRTPLLARPSIVGVFTIAWPAQPMASKRWSSVRTKRMLGGRVVGSPPPAHSQGVRRRASSRLAAANRIAQQCHGFLFMGEPRSQE